MLYFPSPNVAHVLIAGMTGSGKTELLRTMLVSLATWGRPRDMRFYLIDPKGRKLADLARLEVALIGAGVAVWLSLHDQAKGIIMGVGVCTGGVFLGAVFALAIVGVLLLAKLTWGVNVSAPQPPQVVLHGGQWADPSRPLLPDPTQYGPPPAMRPPRQWDILGADDVEKPDGW